MPPFVILIAVAAVAFTLYRAFRVGFVLPAVARKLHDTGRPQLAMQVCERGLTLWSPFGEVGRSDLRLFLAHLLMEQHRYEEAEAHCRKLLACRAPAVQSMARLRLADCLDGQGRKEEAKQERAQVQKLTRNTDDAALLLQRAQLLLDGNNHAEAVEIFLQILQKDTQLPEAFRAQTRVRLALSAWNAGQYPLALDAAEKALESPTLDDALRRTAHNMAALALSNLNRHSDAIVHVEASLALARQSKNQDTIAETLTQLGNLQLQLGQLNEAMALASEALPMSLAARRQSCTLQAEILQAWGRYDDALAAFQSASRAPAYGIPQLAARTQAVLALGNARLYCAKGDGATALEWLEKTTESFAGDAKLEAWAQAARVWALALAGDSPGYESALALFETQLNQLADDTTTQKIGHRAQAEAALAWEDFPSMLAHWEAYINLSPAPIDLRKAWYGVGVAQAALGQPTQARAAWLQAAAPGIESFWTGLAQKRLAEQEKSALTNPA